MTWVSVPAPDTDAAKMQIHLLQEKAQAYVIMLCTPDIMKEE
jgi:hypothetical protein